MLRATSSGGSKSGFRAGRLSTILFFLSMLAVAIVQRIYSQHPLS